MINGPSDELDVGAGADGASLGPAGASVGEGSTFVTEYGGPEEAGPLGVGSDEAMGDDDAASVLDEELGASPVLGDRVVADSALVDTEDGAAEITILDDEDAGVENTGGVSAGAEDGDGKTVVYCVTITTGGTCSDVEGRSSAEGDCTTEVWTEEDTGTAGTAANAEVEDMTDTAGALDARVEESAELATNDTCDAAGVGKTVVYSVFVTTRRDEVIKVELVGGRTTELGDGSEDTVELVVLGAKNAAVVLSSGEYVNMGGAKVGTEFDGLVEANVGCDEKTEPSAVARDVDETSSAVLRDRDTSTVEEATDIVFA
ncbi:hypothetical protein ST47_g10509 [Ascochyta rabiei]|uniref:Uncharacterized protein n=1 Tax=Didymella rabiei TaxID=5454 RepID=A0A162VCM1_DIDRA|nr:hypothetical protein ST47_g10509 [Ascochyta rabiei]